MSSTAIAFIAFACIFGSALAGLYLRSHLPEPHLQDDSLSIVKLATGLIATMAALVLGLLISSAKGSFDRINGELVDAATRVVALDRALADFGPETQPLRAQLKRDFTMRVAVLTSGNAEEMEKLYSPRAVSAVEGLHATLLQLPARDDMQRGLRARALELTNELASTRTLIGLQKDGSIPMPLLVVLIAWLVIIFAAFGLCAPRNFTTVSALLVCSLCASGAIFLILEMDRPLEGLIRIHYAPLLAALEHLGI